MVRREFLLAFALAVILASCGGRERLAQMSPVSADAIKHAYPRSSVSEWQGEKPALHRYPTWQDVTNLIPYRDYYPDVIMVLFKDVGDFSGGDVGTYNDFNANSVRYQRAGQARFARYIAKKYGMTLLPETEAHVEGLSIAGYRISEGSDTEELMQRLLDEQPLIELVEYAPVRELEFIPNDPGISLQWYHGFLGNYEAWDVIRGSEAVWVATIDSGADFTHPDLAQNILPVNEFWKGEDFDLGEPDDVPQDTIGHGTHLAGIVSAIGNNGLGVAGVAFGVKIIPIKVTNDQGLIVGNVPAAIVLAAELGARVINMSFGQYSVSQAESSAIEYAYAKNVILVASAGNDNGDAALHFPSANPQVISVGAVNRDGWRSAYSNFGQTVDVVAPGGYGTMTDDPDMIYSTYLGGYAYLQGTSMSSIIVSGIAALVLSRFGDAYSVNEYRGWIEGSGSLADAYLWKHPFIRYADTSSAIEPSGHRGPQVNILAPAEDSVVSGKLTVQFSVSSETPLLASNLYLDGVIQDSFTIDTTDYFPGEHKVLVEVIDSDYQHGFDSVSFIVTDPRVFPAPYETGFDSPDQLTGWISRSFMGEAYWHVHDKPAYQFDLALGQPDSPSPFFTSQDVDWLLSPNVDLTGYPKTVLRFYGRWSFEPGIRVALRVFGGKGELKVPLEGSLFDGYFSLDISELAGSAVKVMIDVSGGDRGSVNSLRIDDFGIYVSTPRPAVAIISPPVYAGLSGNAEFSAEVTESSNDLDRVDFLVGGELLKSFPALASPYMIVDTDALPNGRTTFSVKAYDNDYVDDDGDGSPLDAGTAERDIFIKNHRITSVSPNFLSWGDVLFISGRDFSHHRENAELKVSFSGRHGLVYASSELILDWADGWIRAKVPYGAKTGSVEVVIDGASAAYNGQVEIMDPLEGFRITSPSPREIVRGDFFVVLPPLPLVDKLELKLNEVEGMAYVVQTKGNTNDIRQLIPASELKNGKYTLSAKAFYEDYVEEITIPIFVYTLPGDFNSDGVVSEEDISFLRDFLRQNGFLVNYLSNAYVPYLDANEDGAINEMDASFIGYRFGAKA